MKYTKVSFLIVLIALFEAHAFECSDISSEVGDVLSNEQVNSESANEAYVRLGKLMAEVDKPSIYFAKEYGNTLECEVLNATNMIRLYTLKKDALKNLGSKYETTFITSYCNELQKTRVCH